MQKNGFTITPESGNGDGTINVSAQKWYGDSDRSTTINVKTHDGKITKTVKVVQKANTKTNVTVTIVVIYKGQSGTNYIFDVSWTATNNICIEEGTYFTPMLSKNGKNIELYRFEYINNNHGSQTDIKIPVSSFNGINPNTFTSDDITADWDLGEQAFDTKIRFGITSIKNIVTVNATVNYSNNEYTFTLSNLSQRLPTEKDDGTDAEITFNYKCDGTIKNTFTINTNSLNNAVDGTLKLSESFRDSDFTANDFELILLDKSFNKYEFKVNIIKAKVNCKLNYNGTQRVLTIQAETQSILKGNINISSIITSEGDRYDGSMIIYSGMQYSDAINITRTDSEESVTVNYSLTGGDALRIPYANDF